MRRRDAGLSLLELLVAVAIMAMGLGLIYQSNLSAVRATSDLAWQQRATLLAQSLLDARDGVPATGWHEAGRAADIEWQADSAPFPAQAGLNVGAPALHEVTIVLRWPGEYRERLVNALAETVNAHAEEGKRPGAGAGSSQSSTSARG